MRGFILFAILVIAHAHSSIAALIIQGPDKPVLENNEVTLECLLSDSELNTSQVHFEKFSKYMNKWYRLEEESMYRRCIPGVILRREASQLLLSIRGIHSYFHQGLYRCVADNATAPDNSSQPLAITVEYMRELSVYDVSSSSRKFIKENLLVTLGEDVEVECSTTASEAPQYFWQKYGDDWIVPSSKLRLKNVRMEDGGDYTCMAEHPTLSSLKKSSTISITVLPASNGRLNQAWYDSTNLVLMTSVAGAVLLVIILSITVFLVRRAKQAKSTKGPIDDHSQKKPIYTASVESLASTSGDKQPLV
ncbi:carcinoembryonic antigen-related cell adhesion molecule 18-like [Oncorhynchus tshawytscha]|uniref:Ig-like domain-containing protein n=1 Tax=Oncorhynchus tshawytscha TaxID=74940 RepID=A0A8C8HG99_ONCTS|nr:carcinoembryonic antigen-related cell adhesion molecule 18-like [Oncorhynchus tshawytscha]